MHDRLVEDWLTRTNERGFEIPFCHLLVGEGHRVIHLTRHGEMEQGKDVLAIDPDGCPCAYQLKGAEGGRITLAQWATFKDQIERLVEIQITHPAVPTGTPHKAFLVTNGFLDEPVRQEIGDRSRQWLARGYPKLDVITKQDFLARLIRLGSAFWPTAPAEVRSLLEMFLERGDGYLDKDKLWQLLLSQLPLDEPDLPKTECARAIRSAAVLCSYALSPYQDAGNHVAVVEGWTMFAATALSLAIERGLRPSTWGGTIDVLDGILASAMDGLADEVASREDLLEGDPLPEAAFKSFYRARATWVVGVLCARALIRAHNGHAPDPSVVAAIEKHAGQLLIWGEAAVPYALAIVWWLRAYGDVQQSNARLVELIGFVCAANSGAEPEGLPDPYHSIGEVLDWELDLGPKPDEDFAHLSYVISSLVLMCAGQELRADVDRLWPALTEIQRATVEPQTVHGLLRWRSEPATVLTEVVPPTQSWSTLRHQATAAASALPRVLRSRPDWLLLWLLTAPHRATPSLVLFLNSWVDSLASQTKSTRTQRRTRLGGRRR